MTYRLPALSFVAVVVAAAGAAAHGAQDLSLGSGQTWQIAGAFPQSQPGPLERQARPVTPENPIPRRTRLVRPPYPPEAAVVGARATVTLRVIVDHLGTVGEVRTVGVPILGAMSPPSPAEERAFTAGLLALIRSAKDAVGQWLYEPPSDAPIAFNVVIGFTSQGDGQLIAEGAGRSDTLLPADDVPHVGGPGVLRGPTKVKHVNPAYPQAARDAKISGVVLLEATIGTDGRVIDARVVRSIPELDAAALDAVKQWVYTPTLLNGVPVPVIMTVTVNFTLQ